MAGSIKIFFIALFLLTWTEKTLGLESRPLSKSLYTVDDFVDIFRGALRAKIEGLSLTYRAKRSERGIVFSSYKEIDCGEEKAKRGAALARIEYLSKKTQETREGKREQILRETIRYYGCGDKLLFVERVISRGEGIQVPSFEDLLKGERRSFQLEKKAQSRTYYFQDKKGEEIFSFFSGEGIPAMNEKERSGRV